MIGFIIGFFTGGFVFVGPGVIAVIVMLVGGGWFRGAIPASLLAKALAMNLFPWFLLMTFIDQSAAKHRPLAFLITFFAAATGIFLRRRWIALCDRTAA